MRDQVLHFFEKEKSHKEIIAGWIGENFKIYSSNKKRQGGQRHQSRGKRKGSRNFSECLILFILYQVIHSQVEPRFLPCYTLGKFWSNPIIVQFYQSQVMLDMIYSQMFGYL